MNVVSLCSGVGLIDLGLEWAGYQTVQFCEINPFGQRIIGERFPGVPIHDDAWTIQPAACDVIAAGFPCQPFSVAGKGLGADDPRHLWPAIIRAVRLARPRYVILENVPGLITRGLGDVLGDLADAGFDAEWTVFSAADVGAPHLRRRVWVVATSDPDASRQWDADGGFYRDGWGSDALAYADREWELQQSGLVGDEWGWSGDGGPEVADAAREREREPADEAHTIAGGRRSWPEFGGRSIGIGRWCAAEPDVRGMADGGSSGMDGGLVDASEGMGTERNTAQGFEGLLREMWCSVASRFASQGRRPDEQLAREFGDALCVLPHVGALEQRETAMATASGVVRGLRKAAYSLGAMRNASDTLAEVWVSLSSQRQEWCWLAARVGSAWAAEWPDTTRVAHGVPARLDRLAALGNGVVPQCAELVGLRLRMLAEGGA